MINAFINNLLGFAVTQSIPNKSGLNKVAEKLNIDLETVIPDTFNALSSSYAELLDMITASIPGALFVDGNNNSIFSYSSFWFHLHILFSYYSFSYYPVYYYQMFSSFTRITNDMYYITAIKTDTVYTNINIYRNQALYQNNLQTQYTQFDVSYSGLLFYPFASLVLNHDILANNFQALKDTYGLYGLHAYLVSNQLSGIRMDVININDPMQDYVDPINNFYYNAFAFFTPNNFFVFNNGIKALNPNNASYQVIKTEYNQNNQINILPDGNVLESYTIRTLYTTYNELMMFYLQKNNHRWTIFNTMHLYGNLGVNIYDQLSTENFNIEKSDIIHLSTTDFPFYNAPDYIYSCTVRMITSNTTLRYYVPLFTYENKYDSYALNIKHFDIVRSDNNNNIVVLLPKYKAVDFNNAELFNTVVSNNNTSSTDILIKYDISNYKLLTFHTYLYSQSNDSFRVIYEYDVPPLTYLQYTYSDILDYKFDFTKVKVGGPLVVRVGQNKYLVYVLQPFSYTFASISGDFYRYNYLQHQTLANLNVFAIEYTNDALFYDPYKSITITYQNKNKTINYIFTFKTFTELHLNAYPMYNNMLQLYVYNEMQLPQQYAFSCLLNNPFSTEVFNPSLYSTTDLQAITDTTSKLYGLLSAAITSVTSTSSLDNAIQFYNTYARQYACQLLLRNYDEYEFIYYSQTRKSLFTFYINSNYIPNELYELVSQTVASDNTYIINDTFGLETCSDTSLNCNIINIPNNLVSNTDLQIYCSI